MVKVGATVKLAEAALSPLRAYDYGEPMRKTWGYCKDPDAACIFFGRNDRVKNLIWC